MKAISIQQFGGSDAMQFIEKEVPLPGPKQVLMKVEACGVNYIDTYQRSGLYKVPLPYVPGLEASGRVESAGEEVFDVKIGDRVASASVIGGYAEYALVDADRVVKVPQHLSAHEAAAFPLQGMTAHYLARSTHPLKAGESCLVHAGAGGVGLLLIQIARMCGATVFTTVSTEEKAALAREAGAHHVILYSREDFEAVVKRETNSHGVTVVYDSVGKDTYLKSMKCLAPRGMLVLFGQSSGPIGAFDPLLLSQGGSLFLTRPSLGNYVATREELLWRAGEVTKWIEEKKLKLRIGSTFPLAQAQDAHKALEGRKTTGKVLLLP